MCSRYVVALEELFFEVDGGKLQLNDWFHVTLVFNGPSKGIVAYKNGTEDGSATDSTTRTRRSSPGYLMIGKFVGNNYASVTVDELTIWNVALTQQEVGMIFRGKNGRNE